jgi:16S rRNA (adenine1518-N6/adenine1519-N6)-dimethyltransferase
MRHVARKRFGQHFLVDEAVIDRIVQAVDPRPTDRLCEIGPG